jgi:hypothetical protein
MRVEREFSLIDQSLCFLWEFVRYQLGLFTTKVTKDTKALDDQDSELRALRVLRGESSFTLIFAVSRNSLVASAVPYSQN